jgi:hypothetical protein
LFDLFGMAGVERDEAKVQSQRKEKQLATFGQQRRQSARAGRRTQRALKNKEEERQGKENKPSAGSRCASLL